MTSYPRWLLDLFGGKTSAAKPDASDEQDPTGGLLELARTLERNGHLHDAAREYANLTRKHATPAILLEHAKLLLAIGDRFGAACNATRVLEIEPQNPGALDIRREVLARDEQERPR